MTAKILIVDDDIDTLQLVGTMLERQGYSILAANNGKKAIDIAQRETPDIILLDVMMPGMDGYEVTRQLRSMDKTAFIPIIMFTAKAQISDKVEGFEAGVDDYLTKPTHPAELIARVKTILSRPKSEAPQTLAIDDSAPTVTLRPPGVVTGMIGAKGGLGVSTLSANLGVSLQRLSEEYTTVVEFNPGRGDIGILLGYEENQAMNELLSMPANQIKVGHIEDRLVTHGSGIHLLLCSYRPEDMYLRDRGEQAEVLINHLKHMGGNIVVDLGSGIAPLTKKVLPLCDQILVIVEPTIQTVTLTKHLIRNLLDIGIEKGKIHTVMNNRIRLEMQIPVPQIETEFGRKFAVVVTPAPELAVQAVAKHDPMVTLEPQSLTAQQINRLGEFILKRSEDLL